jgi:predicted enzyme related to lactoylglutathione lyase
MGRQSNLRRVASKMGQPIVHFEIIGRNPSNLRHFYTDLFGWAFETEGPAARKIVGDYGFVAPAMTSAGYGIPGGVGGGPGFEDRVLFYVGVPDVEAALRSAEEQGGSRIIGPYQERGSDLVVGMFADPEGHVIGVANVT